MTLPSARNEGEGFLEELVDWARSLDEWLPGADNWFRNLLIGNVPDDNYEDVYWFAENYQNLSQAFTTYLDNAGDHGATISGNWSGDATATEFANAWRSVNTNAIGMQQNSSGMYMKLQGYGLQLEIGTFMFILNLVLLAVMLIIDIVLNDDDWSNSASH